MLRRLTFQLLLSSLSIRVIDARLTCLSCVDAPEPRKCQYIVRCGPNEICYGDEYVTPLGYTQFELGCRDTLQCSNIEDKRSINETRIRRGTNNIHICETCCPFDLCNSGTCHQSGFPNQSLGSRGPICIACDQHLAPETCNKVVQCGRNEVCMVKYNTVTNLYESGCKEETVCHNMVAALIYPPISAGGKRSSVGVSDGNNCMIKCCDKDLCTADCSGAIVI